jgi:fatty acid desaturase
MIPRMPFQESLAVLHRDRRNVAIFDIAATFILLGGVITILASYPGPWTFAFAFIAIGLMQYRIVMACHEAVHKTLLFPLWLNETVGSVQCAMVGINFQRYRRQHLAHHAAQDVGQDTDAYIYEPVIRARPGFRRLAVWIFGTAGEIIGKFHQKGFAVTATTEAKGKAFIHSLAIVAVQVLLLAGSTLWLSWWYYFVFWLAPLLTIAIFINRTRVLVEHGYEHVPRRRDSELAAAPVRAIDISANFLERFFIAPFGMNNHSAHHRVPSVPYHRTHELSQLLKQNEGLAPAGRPTYFRALRYVLWT